MRFFGLALVFASFSAMACPNLAGNYSACRSQTGAGTNSTDVVITQDANSYTMTATEESGERSSMTIYTDGRPMVETETDPESGMVFTTTTTASCSGANLVMDSTLEVQGQSLGAFQMVVNRQGSAMVQTLAGQVLGQEINDTVVCE